MRLLCEKYNIKKLRSSPNHPEGDGISERQIQTMKWLFRTKLNDQKLLANHWSDLLPDVQLAMYNKIHSSAEQMFGDKLRRGHKEITFQEETLIEKESKIKKEIIWHEFPLLWMTKSTWYELRSTYFSLPHPNETDTQKRCYPPHVINDFHDHLQLLTK